MRAAVVMEPVFRLRARVAADVEAELMVTVKRPCWAIVEVIALVTS